MMPPYYFHYEYFSYQVLLIALPLACRLLKSSDAANVVKNTSIGRLLLLLLLLLLLRVKGNDFIRFTLSPLYLQAFLAFSNLFKK